jgi:hypothetical protein
MAVYRAGMRAIIAALVLVVATAVAALAGDAVIVLQETRTRLPGKKQGQVEHVALLRNAALYAIHALRVTVELHDPFGKLLWVRTVRPGPSSLRPGERASLSVSTPYLEAYKKTVYRFDYKSDVRPH